MLDANFYAAGRQKLAEALAETSRINLKPPPKLKLSDWAAKYGKLSLETSATTGDFHAYAYQIGIMDSVTDPTVLEISVMKGARVGYTRIMDMAFGYYTHHDPSPILIVQPSLDDAEDYSKTEIMPMIRDTPELSLLLGDPKAKDSGNTILSKTFKNGASLKLVGANSPGGFRRITIRVVIFDEVDGYPTGGAGNEGDQLSLGIKRTLSFWNRRIIKGSTPTIAGLSRIETAFNEGDQRYFFVPCPHCGEYQHLEWGGPEIAYGFKWDRDKDGNGIPESVFYVCKKNFCVIYEIDKTSMVEKGEWRATKPFKGHASFHVWAAYSNFPNAAWPMLVKEWLEAKGDPLRRQTFYNTVLGLPYEDFGEGAIRASDIYARREGWGEFLPPEIELITVGIDIQDYRVEIETTGWGPDEESWSIEHEVIDGAFSDKLIQELVDKYLLKHFRKENGATRRIACACIDSGGHHTQAVYDFCKTRLGRKVFAIKGGSEPGGKRSPVWPTSKPTHRKKKAFRPIILGVNAAKDVIYKRLSIDTPGPGFMHFPPDRSENYFAQLTAEKLVAKFVNGFRFRVWELPPGRSNEVLDTTVYSYAALCALKQFNIKLSSRRSLEPPEPETVVENTETPAQTAASEPVAPAKPAAPVERPKGASVTVVPNQPIVGNSDDAARSALLKRLVGKLA